MDYAVHKLDFASADGMVSGHHAEHGTGRGMAGDVDFMRRDGLAYGVAIPVESVDQTERIAALCRADIYISDRRLVDFQPSFNKLARRLRTLRLFTSPLTT